MRWRTGRLLPKDSLMITEGFPEYDLQPYSLQKAKGLIFLQAVAK